MNEEKSTFRDKVGLIVVFLLSCIGIGMILHWVSSGVYKWYEHKDDTKNNVYKIERDLKQMQEIVTCINDRPSTSTESCIFKVKVDNYPYPIIRYPL
jgi:hypothetical protein